MYLYGGPMIATIRGLNRSPHVCIYLFIFLFSYYFYIIYNNNNNNNNNNTTLFQATAHR